MLAGSAALDAGEEAQAEALLRDAFAIARRTGVLNPVYVPRADLAELWAFALERGIEPALADRIVRGRRLAPGPRARRVATWPWPVRVEALGGLALRGGAVAARTAKKVQQKPLELLRLLVAFGERGATTERLAAFDTTVYRLRRLLGDPASVVHCGGRAALDARRVFVDAWAVEWLAAHAEVLRATGCLAGSLRARPRHPTCTAAISAEAVALAGRCDVKCFVGE